MKTMLNHGKLCKTIKVYYKKVIALVWENIVLNSFFWRTCPHKLGQLCRRTHSTQYIPKQVQ